MLNLVSLPDLYGRKQRSVLVAHTGKTEDTLLEEQNFFSTNILIFNFLPWITKTLWQSPVPFKKNMFLSEKIQVQIGLQSTKRFYIVETCFAADCSFSSWRELVQKMFAVDHPFFGWSTANMALLIHPLQSTLPTAQLEHKWHFRLQGDLLGPFWGLESIASKCCKQQSLCFANPCVSDWREIEGV